MSHSMGYFGAVNAEHCFPCVPLSWGSTPARSHSLTSVFTHLDYVFLDHPSGAVMLSVFRLGLWCHRCSGSCNGHSGWGVQSPRFVTLQHRIDTGCAYLAAYIRRKVAGSEDGQEYHELSSGYPLPSLTMHNSFKGTLRKQLEISPR